MVKKRLNKEFASDIFDSYFEMIDHSINTRNNKHCIKLPPVKLEVARHDLYFTGVTLYNRLPIDIRKTDSVNIFKKKFLDSLNNVLSFKFMICSFLSQFLSITGFYILNFLQAPICRLFNSCISRLHFSGRSCHSGFYLFVLDG